LPVIASSVFIRVIRTYLLFSNCGEKAPRSIIIVNCLKGLEIRTSKSFRMFH
jgi:hypothetical protein